MRQRIMFMILPLLIVVTTMTASAEGWRGIIPLRSTCEDIKRVLKVDKCVSPESEYNLPDFKVVIFFSQNNSCEHDPRDWKVSPGTVTSIVISPTKETRASELGINISRFKKLSDSDVAGMERYENRREGVTVELFKGFVQSAHFYPPQRYEKLRCKPSGIRP